METGREIEILESLSDGKNPFTGELFPENSPYRHPDTVSALLKAIDALSKVQSREVRQGNLPEKAGKPWTDEEDNELTRNYEAGRSLKEISEQHKRTAGAIKSRLIKLGKITL
jgi:hypothetical protein